MLDLQGVRGRFCNGITRRDFLKLGTLGFGGLTLADYLRLKAQGAVVAKGGNKAVIMIVLQGGPSHIDTYDLKPQAPAEYRGEFKPIKTNVPGIEICELMPLQAKIADKLVILRGFQTADPCHTLEEVITGFPPRENRPAFGSIVSRLRDDGRGLPSYVSLTTERRRKELDRAESPGYAGAAHRPFIPEGPALNNLSLTPDMTLNRLDDRKALLGAFDTIRRNLDVKGELAGMDTFTARALEMISSRRARDAFDISREPEQVKARYVGRVKFGSGRTFRGLVASGYWEGNRFLQARRLVEAGVPVVTLTTGVNWDHHGFGSIVPESLFVMLRSLLPLLDRSLYALVTDLCERGLDKDVAVVMWGEFGRTPRINANAGRDHWNPANFALLAGGGLRMGQVIGQTDARAEQIKERLVTPQNVMATLYHVLGLDPAQTLPDFNGRPMHLLDNCDKIAELVQG